MAAGSVHALFGFAAVMLPGSYLPVVVGRLLRTHRLMDPLYVRIGWSLGPCFALAETGAVLEALHFGQRWPAARFGLIDRTIAVAVIATGLAGLALALIATVETAGRSQLGASADDVSLSLDHFIA